MREVARPRRLPPSSQLRSRRCLEVSQTLQLRGLALISLNGSSATGGSVLSSGYDPIVRASRVSELVCRSEGGVESRLYYRFRADRWYGGIATGDVIGCNLSCVFC